jgi:hypothetical protein
MELNQRRRVYRLVQVGLVLLVVAVAAMWLLRRSPARHFTVQTEAPPVEALGPGDLQIFNVDSTVDMILKDDKILAGLSPKTVAKVRDELARTDRDTGLGGSIAKFVKQTVADKIGTRVVYNIADIRDMRYENERFVIEWKRGGDQQLFGNVKVDGDRDANRFRSDDARRFIDAVKARQKTLP